MTATDAQVRIVMRERNKGRTQKQAAASAGEPQQGLTDTVQFTWDVTGMQLITATASNAFTTVVDTHTLALVTFYDIYLPMVVRAMPAP